MKLKSIFVSGLIFLSMLTLIIQWPGPLKRPCIVYIPPDMAGRKVATFLEELGIIRSRILFEIWARLSGQRARAGEYLIEPKANLSTVVSLLHHGAPYLRKITIPEGLSSTQIVALLNKETFLSGTPIDAIPPEGTLWPETYTFARGQKRAFILLQMQKMMEVELDKLWVNRPKDFLLKDPYELVILASIIEREAGKDDRHDVAGVFLNRLKHGIPLQADASVIYALCHNQQILGRPLSQADLRIRDPYNTYHIRGLPPGPICNPGRAALRAVLEAKETENFYFVVKPGGGGHVFSRQLHAHNKNVHQWRKSMLSVQ